MSQTILYQYNIHCLTEDLIILGPFLPGVPTACPHNNTHSIAPVLPTDLVSTNATQTVNIFQGGNANLYHMTRGYTFPINSTQGSVTTFSFTTLMQTTPRVTTLTPTSLNVGDTVSLFMAAGVDEGLTTAAVNVGDTVINVDAPTIANMQIGLFFAITDGTNTSTISMCSAVGASTITAMIPSSFAFAVGSQIIMYVPRAVNILICNNNNISSGLDNLWSDNIAAGTTLTVYYTNTTGGAKTFTFLVTAKFGQ